MRVIQLRANLICFKRLAREYSDAKSRVADGRAGLDQHLHMFYSAEADLLISVPPSFVATSWDAVEEPICNVLTIVEARSLFRM